MELQTKAYAIVGPIDPVIDCSGIGDSLCEQDTVASVREVAAVVSGVEPLSASSNMATGESLDARKVGDEKPWRSR